MTPGRREHTPATLVFVLPGAVGTIVVTAVTIYLLAVNNSEDCPHDQEDCPPGATTKPPRPLFPDNDLPPFDNGLPPFVAFRKGRSRHLHRSERRSRAASESNLTVVDFGRNELHPFEWEKVMPRVQNRRLDLPQEADEGRGTPLVHSRTSAVPAAAPLAPSESTETTAQENAADSNAVDLPPGRSSIETRTTHFITSTATVRVGSSGSTTSPGGPTNSGDAGIAYSPWTPKSLWEEASRIDPPVLIALAAMGCLGVLLLGTCCLLLRGQHKMKRQGKRINQVSRATLAGIRGLEEGQPPEESMARLNRSHSLRRSSQRMPASLRPSYSSAPKAESFLWEREGLITPEPNHPWNAMRACLGLEDRRDSASTPSSLNGLVNPLFSRMATTRRHPGRVPHRHRRASAGSRGTGVFLASPGSPGLELAFPQHLYTPVTFGRTQESSTGEMRDSPEKFYDVPMQ